MTPYRMRAEVPDYSEKEEVAVPKEREPWTTWGLCIFWGVACVVGLDLSLIVAEWSNLTVHSVASAAVVHFGIAAVTVPFVIAVRSA